MISTDFKPDCTIWHAWSRSPAFGAPICPFPQSPLSNSGSALSVRVDSRNSEAVPWPGCGEFRLGWGTPIPWPVANSGTIRYVVIPAEEDYQVYIALELNLPPYHNTGSISVPPHLHKARLISQTGINIVCGPTGELCICYHNGWELHGAQETNVHDGDFIVCWLDRKCQGLDRWRPSAKCEWRWAPPARGQWSLRFSTLVRFSAVVISALPVYCTGPSNQEWVFGVLNFPCGVEPGD